MNESKDLKIDSYSLNNTGSLNQLDDFLTQVSENKQIPKDVLRNSFRDIKPLELVRKLVSPPPVTLKKNWQVYRDRMIEPIRIAAATRFWQENRAFLEQTEQKTGVPAEILIGIIGIETNYGSNMGKFPVRDVLTTLAFDYPDAPNKESRQNLFKDQLTDLIVYCWTGSQQKPNIPFDRCLKQPSSFAGAIGMPQFMPGSIRRYAVDGDGDGLIDLRTSNKDAIASVANFMLEHGWQKQQPIFLEIQNTQTAITAASLLADGDPTPKYTLGLLKKNGVIDTWPAGLTENSPALIVDLPSPDKNGGTIIEYVVGLKNFEVITLYNRSFFYAKTVTDFGYKVGALMRKPKVNDSAPSRLNDSPSKKKTEIIKKKKKKTRPGIRP